MSSGWIQRLLRLVDQGEAVWTGKRFRAECDYKAWLWGACRHHGSDCCLPLGCCPSSDANGWLVAGEGTTKAPLEYTGMVDAFRKTVRYEGFGVLYKGLVPNSVKVAPFIAIAFVTCEAVKDFGVKMRI